MEQQFQGRIYDSWPYFSKPIAYSLNYLLKVQIKIIDLISVVVMGNSPLYNYAALFIKSCINSCGTSSTMFMRDVHLYVPFYCLPNLFFLIQVHHCSTCYQLNIPGQFDVIMVSYHTNELVSGAYTGPHAKLLLVIKYCLF